MTEKNTSIFAEMVTGMISVFDEKTTFLDGDEEKERELFMNLMDDILSNFSLEDNKRIG